MTGGAVVRRGRHYLERDGRPILPVGAHLVPPEGPDWPWRGGAEPFRQAFAAMRDAGLDTVRIDLLWSAVEPAAGHYDEGHLAQLDALLAAARANGLWLHPTLFVGGEVGDAFWDTPWRAGRHPHRDPEMLRLQVAQAAMLAGRWRGDPSILAWDLTDEPPFWVAPETTDAEAAGWTRAIADALRSEDPEHLVTIGTSGQEIGWGPFRADVVAETLDFGCVHPYPIYQPSLYPDGLLAPRTTHAAAFETALAAGAGRPVMVHEYGASSAQFDPERIAAHDRLLAWSSLGRGAIGFLAWCWTDATKAAYARAPYVRQPHETQFGVTDASGALRPRGQVLRELAAAVGHVDLGGLAADGPAATVAIIVPHEYARPFDSAAYGLDVAPAGRYEPAERAWQPDRDITPLAGAWLNAFVMAARAGLSVTFPRERLDDVWPKVPIVLLPAPLATSANTLHHVRTSFWRGAAEHVTRGGALWLSCSADVAIPEMDELAGCHLVDRAPVGRAAVLRFVRRWGPFEAGDELVLTHAGTGLATRGAILGAADAEVVAVDADGAPALLIARRGGGAVVTCGQPVELLQAQTPDAHGPTDRTWGLYAGLAEVAGVSMAGADHPDVTSGELRGPAGGLLALTNHGSTPVRVPVRLPSIAARAASIGPGGVYGLPVEASTVELELPAYGAAIVGWRRGEGVDDR